MSANCEHTHTHTHMGGMRNERPVGGKEGIGDITYRHDPRHGPLYPRTEGHSETYHTSDVAARDRKDGKEVNLR